MITRFDISCELEYFVSAPSEFVFNVQAANVPQQKLLTEDLLISGASTVTEHLEPDTGNRFVRASAQQGPLKLEYSTLLELRHIVAPPSELEELAVADLPPRTLRFVLPSRYCGV